MSKGRFVVLGLAAVSAVLAAYLAKGFIGQKPKKEIVEINKVVTDDVLVAAKNVQMGELLASGSVSWQSWPKDSIKDIMITKSEAPDAKEQYAAARARVALYEGEPVMDKKVIKSGESGFMAAILGKGYRAVAVRISEATGAGGFILPNDRVDVILTRKLESNDGIDKTIVSETLISNVRVLAVNQIYKQDPETGEISVAKAETATLELDLQSSEVIAMAETAGQLSLALRSIAEIGEAGLADAAPVLSDKYAKGMGKGNGGGTLTTVRYGIQKQTSSN